MYTLDNNFMYSLAVLGVLWIITLCTRWLYWEGSEKTNTYEVKYWADKGKGKDASGNKVGPVISTLVGVRRAEYMRL